MQHSNYQTFTAQFTPLKISISRLSKCYPWLLILLILAAESLSAARGNTLKIEKYLFLNVFTEL